MVEAARRLIWRSREGIYLSIWIGQRRPYVQKRAYRRQEFLDDLADGTVRFNAGDLIQVDLEVTERRTRSGKMKNPQYRILSVADYRPLRVSKQETFADFLDKSEEVRSSKESEE